MKPTAKKVGETLKTCVIFFMTRALGGIRGTGLRVMDFFMEKRQVEGRHDYPAFASFRFSKVPH